MIDTELKTLIGKILRIDIKELGIPLYGRLLEVSPFWITIERKNGSNRIISKARIMGIEPVRDQQC
jgi:hypothetical protein